MIKKRRWISASSSCWNSWAMWKKILVSSLVVLGTVFVFPFILFFICVISILSIPIVILGIFVCCFVKKFIEVSERWKWESPLSFSFEANDDPFSNDEFFPNIPDCAKSDKSKDEDNSDSQTISLDEEVSNSSSSKEDRGVNDEIEQDLHRSSLESKDRKENSVERSNYEVPYRRSYYNQE